MQSYITCPLTGMPDAQWITAIPSRHIITLYREQVLIDVSENFVGIETVDIYRCNKTGYQFYYPAEIIGDGKFYEHLQKTAETHNGGYYRQNQFDHQYAASLISPNDKLLEIGSGDGSFLKSILPISKNITGIELNAYAAAKSRKEGLDVIDDLIEVHAPKHIDFYDTICSFQVLEHIYDVKGFLESALQALKPGGKLIISVPNNEPYFFRFNKYETLNLPPHHMGLWNKHVFKKLEGFLPIKLKNVVYSTSYNWKIDAYYRVKKWTGVRTVIHKHSIFEKIKMGMLFPVSAILSIADKMRRKVNGTQICVYFEKNSFN